MTKISQYFALKQTLKMTTSMQQSVNILQMSSLELEQFARAELEKNPFLEDGKVLEEVTNTNETQIHNETVAC